MDLSFCCVFFLYTEFTSDVSQDSGSHGNVQYGNRRSMFLNHSMVFLKEKTME